MKWPFPDRQASDEDQAEWLARRLGDAPVVTQQRDHEPATVSEYEARDRHEKMAVRLGTWHGTSEQLEAWVEQVAQAKGRMERTPGIVAAYWLIDPESGTAQTITVWDSETSMIASEGRQPRNQAPTAEQLRTAVVMEHYEVIDRLTN